MSTDRMERLRRSIGLAGGPLVTPTLHRINFLVLITLLLLNGGYSYNANRQLIRNELRIQDSHAILVAIKNVYSGLQEAEAGLRGYVITADSEHLVPYERSIEELEAHMRVLAALQPELEVQKEGLLRFVHLVEQTKEEMDAVVELAQSDRYTATVRLLRPDRGKASLTEIRGLVGVMEAREYSLIAQQREAAQTSRDQVLRSIHTATLAGLVFLTIAFLLVQRAMRMERENVAKLILTNEELEAIVAKRTHELDLYATELRRSNRELQDFAFVASHDLQEPLRKIRAFGDRLKTRYAEQLGDGADYVNRMQAAAERMSRLINDLLTFSRVSTKARGFEMTSLQSTLTEVLDDLGEVIEEKHARIVSDPLPEIEADATQMRQLLQNLIGNALKFVAPTTAPEVRITSASSVPGDDGHNRVWYRITIADNGVGFDERFAGKIFTPFQRLHARDTYPGTGIGLAVCRRVVERHGGRIEVESHPGVGTTFRIDLPETQLQVEASSIPDGESAEGPDRDHQSEPAHAERPDPQPDEVVGRGRHASSR